MPTISPRPDTKAPDNPTPGNTRAGRIRARLPRAGLFLSEIVRQQGALIALILVVIFSFLRYDNFDSITIDSVLSLTRNSG